MPDLGGWYGSSLRGAPGKRGPIRGRGPRGGCELCPDMEEFMRGGPILGRGPPGPCGPIMPDPGGPLIPGEPNIPGGLMGPIGPCDGPLPAPLILGGPPGPICGLGPLDPIGPFKPILCGGPMPDLGGP